MGPQFLKYFSVTLQLTSSWTLFFRHHPKHLYCSNLGDMTGGAGTITDGQINETLKKYFGYDSLRSVQCDAVQ